MNTQTIIIATAIGAVVLSTLMFWIGSKNAYEEPEPPAVIKKPRKKYYKRKKNNKP